MLLFFFRQLQLVNSFLYATGHTITMESFAPDGKQMIVAIRDTGQPYINIINFETGNFEHQFGSNITPDSQTQRIGSIFWLP